MLDYAPPPLDLHGASQTSAPATPTRSLTAHTRSPAAIDIRGLCLGSPHWPDSLTSSEPTSPALDSHPIHLLHSPRAFLGPQCAPLFVTPRATTPMYGSPASAGDEARDGGVGGGEGGREKGGGSSSRRGSEAGEGVKSDAGGGLSDAGGGLTPSSFDASGALRPVAAQAVLASRLEQGLRSLAQSPLFRTRARP